MLEIVHRIGSKIRHSPVLKNQAWLWERIEPGWQSAFSRLSRNRGFSTYVNGDVFRLEYCLGARYDRYDQRFYEPVFYQAFVQRVQPGETVFDIGAHFGFFTLGAAKRLQGEGRVYSFEPSPQTAMVLERHVSLNHGEDRVEVVKAVVADVDGTVTFYAHGATMAASLSRENVEVLNPERPTTPAQEIRIPSVTLDRFCRSRGVKPNLIKIDVEGAELLVLRGARELLRNNSLAVLCEVHPQQMQNCGTTIAQLDAYLDSIGYGATPLDEPNPAGIFHALIAPRS